MINCGGLEFQGDGNGGASIKIKHDTTENAETVRTVIVSPEEWAEVIREVRPSQAERILDVIDEKLAGEGKKSKGTK